MIICVFAWTPLARYPAKLLLIDAFPPTLVFSLSTSNQDQLIGTLLAEKYRIVDIVGYGSMSTVYKATHNLIDRVVAVKLLHAHHLKDAATVKRFRQEAVALSHLSHPNVVAAFDFGLLSDGRPYLVMDFVKGQSLEDLLDNQGAKEAPWLVKLAIEVCRALGHAHQVGVLHRDLKPANIILGHQPENQAENQFDNEITVKVVDFGLATFLPEAFAPYQPLTQPTEVPGSPAYMSPEQCRGLKLDARSDIYALGIVMYEVLTGIPPLVGEDWIETMRKQVFTQPIPPSAVHPLLEIPQALEDIVLKCLNKDPKDRFSSMFNLEQALKSLPVEKKGQAAFAFANALKDKNANGTKAILVVENLDSQRQHLVDLLNLHVPCNLTMYQAKTGSEALALASSVKPDLVITDIQTPDMSVITMAQNIWSKCPDTKILFWSQHLQQTYLSELKEIVPEDAICGYALKTASDEKLVYAILSLLIYNNPYLDPAIRAQEKKLNAQNQDKST